MGLITKLPDAEIIRRYKNGDCVTDMAREYGVSGETIYRHMRKKKVKPNRKPQNPWTPEEEKQLIDAHNAGMTGRELWSMVPTRSHVAAKCHVRRLYSERKIGHDRIQ